MDLSSLNPYITRRRSVHNFLDKTVPEDTMEALVDFLSEQNVPFGDIDWNFDTLPYDEFFPIVARGIAVKAPHYLLLRAERKYNSLQNTGYLGELASLFLLSQGLGSCFLGGVTISEDFPDTLPYVIALAFGYTQEPERTGAGDFVRKPLQKVSIGELSGVRRDMAEAAILAPTSMRRQPVRFMAVDGKVHLFRTHVLLKNPVLSYDQCIDVGCAMANMHVAGAAAGVPVHFTVQDPAPSWGKNIYQATLML